MTGWSFEACRNLYYPEQYLRPQPTTHEDAHETTESLVGWLATYRDSLAGWGPAELDDVCDRLDQMIRGVMPGSLAGHRVELKAYDLDFAKVKGVVRSKVPYAYYAVLLGSDFSRLRFQRRDDEIAKTAGRLRENLSKIKAILPDGAFEMIDNDLGQLQNHYHGLRGPAGKVEKDAELVEKELDNAGKETEGAVEHAFGKPGSSGTPDETMKDYISIWTDLILGTISVIDALGKRGRTLLYLVVLLAGIGLFIGLAGIVYGVFIVVPTILSVNPSALSISNAQSILSTLQTVVPTLATVGLSISLLGTKAWNGVKAFETWSAVQVAKRHRLRKRVLYNRHMSDRQG